MEIEQPENIKDVILVLATDIPCGVNGAFAPTLAAWHRMVLSRANYTCEQCGKKIPIKWRLSGHRKLARNSAHHIISQNLADSCRKPQLKLLLANGLANCESCHWNEHRRLGGYEYTGALRAFSRFKGLEILDETGVGNTLYLGLSLSTDKDLSRLYDIFLWIVLDYMPSLKAAVDSSKYEDKALVALSQIFYLNVYKELESLGWDKMSEWTRDELLDAVNKANERWWNEDVEYLIEEYDRFL